MYRGLRLGGQHGFPPRDQHAVALLFPRHRVRGFSKIGEPRKRSNAIEALTMKPSVEGGWL